MCFHGVGDVSSKIIKEWTKDSKKEQKEPRFGYVQGHAAACVDFKPKSKIREEHVAAWPIHAAACHVKAEKASLKIGRAHV